MNTQTLVVTLTAVIVAIGGCWLDSATNHKLKSESFLPIRENSWSIVSLDKIHLYPESSDTYSNRTDVCARLAGERNDTTPSSCLKKVFPTPSDGNLYLNCIVANSEGKADFLPAAKRRPTFGTVMARVDWGRAIILFVLVAALTYFDVGTKPQASQYLNNVFYLVGMALFIYLALPNHGFFSPHPIGGLVVESYNAFKAVHPMSSPWIAISHFATYWFKIASWRAKSLRNLLFWQLLVETVTAFVNEYTHHMESQDEVRCMRMAFIDNVKNYAFDDTVRVYVLPPFFVYGYLLPQFMRHWILGSG